MQADNERCEQENSKMEQVALSFQTAMKGIGTDESRIIREIVAYTNRQRQMIKTKYFVLTGNELTDDLKSELSGNFLDAVLALFTPLDEYEASIIHDAIDGIETNEKKVIEILCSKSAQEIETLKSGYKRVYDHDLEDDIKMEEGGDLGRLFRSLASGGRNKNHGYDQDYIEKLAQDLYDAGEGKAGTEEKDFIKILCTCSFAELNAMFALYKEKFEKDLEQVIQEEFSGHLCKALLAIVKSVRSRPAYFAELIGRSLKKKNNFEKDLLQVLIRRGDIDLPEILSEFKRMYNRSLKDVIQKETDGEFQKLMLAFLKKY